MKPAPERTTLFVKSNIGTNMATSVPTHSTVEHLKGKQTIQYSHGFAEKLAKEHFNCFPDIGWCTVRHLMIKKKGVFYILSNSMHIDSVFLGELQGWLIYMEICLVKSASVDIPTAIAPCTNLSKPSLGIAETISDPGTQGKEEILQGGCTTEDSLQLGKTCSRQSPERSVSKYMSVSAIISMYFTEVGEEVSSASDGRLRGDMTTSNKLQPGISLAAAGKFSSVASYQQEAICNNQQYNITNRDGISCDNNHSKLRSDADTEERNIKNAGIRSPGSSEASRKPLAEAILLQPFPDPSSKTPKTRNRKKDIGTPLRRAANNIRNEVVSANTRFGFLSNSIVQNRHKKENAHSSGNKVFDINESES